MNRRQLLTSLSGVVGAGLLSGCTDIVDGVTTSREDELRQHWEQNDDYPDDESRNRQTPLSSSEFTRRETTPFWGENIMGNTTGWGDEYTYDIIIDSVHNERMDVYVTPPPDEWDDSDSFEYFNGMGQENVVRFETTITVPDDEAWYLFVFKSGKEPSMSIMRDYEEVTVDMMVEGYYYLSFEEYKQALEEQS